VPTPWDSAFTGSLRTLEPFEFAGGRGRGMNGTHRPEGILLAVGEGADALRVDSGPRLEDVAPTLLSALGVAPDAALDGIPLGAPPRAYGSEEEALVAERLRQLGYLE
jgi:hypothetical protein